MSRSFKIHDDGEVEMFEDGVFAGKLGTILPDNEQIARVLARAFNAGRTAKAHEIREVLGVRDRG